MANNGKICVSVCAGTAGELVEQIERAVADVVEVRFDCLESAEIQKLGFKLPDISGQYLATFRPAEQGGKRRLSLRERLKFWEAFFLNFAGGDFLVDFEFDLNHAMNLEKTTTVISFHDFHGVPDNLQSVYDFMAKTDGSIIKIAVRADDITDAIPVWKLLERARAQNRRMIPIAMGEAGKWTRILGLAHGAFLTYAAPDEKSATAPGQVTARDLVEVYRAKVLDENTEIYGIVGGNTSYSMSPFIHNAAFKALGSNAVFVPLQVSRLDEFMRRMVRPETREIELNFRGLAVTIPHKQAIMPYLDDLDETAQAIGAVNTVKIEKGRLTGFNTDAHGFIKPLKNIYGPLASARVAVLGAGGAARACIYALKKENADVTIFARDPAKAQRLAAEFKVALKALPVTGNQRPETDFRGFDILVNTTPLGTRGEHENKTAVVAEQMKDVRLVYDLVYNPQETRLLREAQSAQVPTVGGLEMLVAQAIEQQRVWTGTEPPINEMRHAAIVKLKV